MGSALSFPFPHAEALSPEELRLVFAAFEAALLSLEDSVGVMNAHARRHLLARYIVEKAMNGDRDVMRLRDGALSQRGIAAFTAARAHRHGARA